MWLCITLWVLLFRKIKIKVDKSEQKGMAYLTKVMIAASIFPLAVIIFEAIFYYIGQANRSTYVSSVTNFYRNFYFVNNNFSQKFTCTPNQFSKANVIARYFDIASVILSYLIYFMLWRQIKVSLNNGIANVQKKWTLEKGINQSKY